MPCLTNNDTFNKAEIALEHISSKKLLKLQLYNYLLTH